MLVRSANLNIMMKAAVAAGRALTRDFNEVEKLQVSKKGPGDFVSVADKKAESIIFTQLQKARPEYAFLMEEGGSVPPLTSPQNEPHWDEPYCFVIDPLDGTTNFLHGLPHFAVSIGLMRGQELIAGCVYDPIKDEHFWAESGKGAYIGSQRIRVSAREQLADSIFATGIPFIGHNEAQDGHQKFLRQLGRVMANSAGVRRFGAAALDLCYVAAGRYDGYWEAGLSPWDVCAGALIAREAGAKLSQTDGGDWTPDHKTIICANPKLHGKLAGLLAKP